MSSHTDQKSTKQVAPAGEGRGEDSTDSTEHTPEEVEAAKTLAAANSSTTTSDEVVAGDVLSEVTTYGR